MSSFWFFAAVLVLLVVAGLLWPLLMPSQGDEADDELAEREAQNVAIAREKLAELKREREQGRLDEAAFNEAKQDLEAALAIDLAASASQGRRVVSGMPLALIAVALVPLVGLGVYNQLGRLDLATGAAPNNGGSMLAQADHQARDQAGSTAEGSASGDQPSLQVMVGKLEQRLKSEPDNVDGWLMLGRSYAVLQEYDKAVAAYRKADALSPDDADILPALAESIAMKQGAGFEGEPRQLLEKALSLNPRSASSLWMLGVAAVDRHEPATAVEFWKRLLPLVDDQEAHGELVKLIASQEQAAGLPVSVDVAAASSSVAPTSTANAGPSSEGLDAGISVTVSLDPSMAAKVSPQDLVFIYAKAVSGPPMPLAAVRAKAADLPMTVTLSDAQAMMPQMRLSMFDQVTVGARVSKSGSPIPGSGDLFAERSPVDVAATPKLELMIDQVKP